jgi:flavin reductase (DIM6/NTAB) family NADH-FMN oxidoreductase RutF
MFYETARNDHGLPHDPFHSLVVPRPIGWLSTLGPTGVVNLAPYSFFNIVGTRPHYVMFSSAERKDSQRNAEDTGEFVVNMATWALREEVNASSATHGPEVSEPDLIGLAMTPSRLVRPPRVARAPVALECTYTKTVGLPGIDGRPHRSSIVIGLVVGVHIADEFLVDGLVDVARIRPLARLGYMDYAAVESVFAMPRPKKP